jgi:hypothetical protein
MKDKKKPWFNAVEMDSRENFKMRNKKIETVDNQIWSVIQRRLRLNFWLSHHRRTRRKNTT